MFGVAFQQDLNLPLPLVSRMVEEYHKLDLGDFIKKRILKDGRYLR